MYWTQNTCAPLSTCSFLILDSSLSALCQGNGCVLCVSCIWADKGNQVLLCFYKLYSQRDKTSRIKTILQAIKNFWLLQVSLQDSSSQGRSFRIWPLEKGGLLQTSKVRLSSQFMLCWVESVRIQIKVHIFQWQEGNGYVNTQVLTSICIKLCKHIHLLRSEQILLSEQGSTGASPESVWKSIHHSSAL